MSVGKKIQTIIRNIHKKYFLRELSDSIGLYFHAVEKDNINEFINIIKYFQDSGYIFEGPEEHVSSQRKSIFLSFDDNYNSWYFLSDILQKYGIKAAFYVNTLPIRDASSEKIIEEYFIKIRYNGEKKTLSSDELRSMHGTGQIIGSHTHSHEMLTRMPFKEACEDILNGKKKLEDILGKEVEHFSYPFGMRRHFNKKLKDYCVQSGIKTIANAIPCMQYSKRERYNIYRTKWDFEKIFNENIENLRIDGRIFEALTGRSAIG